ncbi:ArsR/SmtB family transcription factor [Salinibacterium hongtaonis]|uniref:ArsR family transcriptional regulator n=1 Tax=Homoserinimonas hongtaonis TaxID=2079791 RepID=A0A2U1SY38_9MICO|nr:metalloregulator ArsR/SmtB family transcription factor [Salinibacterium hongtaonis]AWB89070.1 transcriptional regulator [Salinibacterium hongtaonis]PWB96519.1 ArsR family transcriptional regulator [Salinibacterium hongtaonis]
MVVDSVRGAEIDRIFQALADATRRDIVTRAANGEHSVSSLARRYDMSLAAVQKHVAVLERADLIVKKRKGREQIVQPNPHAFRRARDLLDSYEALWRHRVEAIDDILAQE